MLGVWGRIAGGILSVLRPQACERGNHRELDAFVVAGRGPRLLACATAQRLTEVAMRAEMRSQLSVAVDGNQARAHRTIYSLEHNQ
jgi:hypothetical protein